MNYKYLKINIIIGIMFIYIQTFSQNSKLPIFESKSFFLKIKMGKQLKIDGKYNSKKYLKEVVTDEIYEKIYYDKNVIVDDIVVNTYNITNNDYTGLSSNQIYKFDCEKYNFSDCKYHLFVYPSLKPNSYLNLSYNKEFKNMYLLEPYYFGEEVYTKESELIIQLDKRITLEYALFNIDTSKLEFNKFLNDDMITYRWKLRNIEAVKPEPYIAPFRYNTPHIIYYIKSYINSTKDTVYVNNDIHTLFNWAKQFVKYNDDKNDNIIERANQICKNISDSLEQAKALFYWVQKNIAYTAVEFGDLAFSPISAKEVLLNKNGDCKGKSNLLYEFLKALNYDAKLCWIGTIDKPYTLSQLPNQHTFNHMIVLLKFGNKEYFLDPTDANSYFDIPSDNIAGKDVLIYEAENNFKIAKTPIINADFNNIIYNIDYFINENKSIAQVKVDYKGYTKKEIRNKIIKFKNHADFNLLDQLGKINEENKIENNTLKMDENNIDSPLQILSQINLPNYLKKINQNYFFNPFIFRPFSEYLIDTLFEKYTKYFSYLKKITFNINVHLPNNIQISKFPENEYFDNDIVNITKIFNFKNPIKTIQCNLTIKKLFLYKKDFKDFNIAIEKLNKIFKQNIFLQVN